MKRILYENSLSLVMLGLFFVFLVGQSITGHREHNQELKEHNKPGVTYIEYGRSGHFIEAVFENWESEFLQMAAYVLLTIFLRQKGSPESKKLEGKEPVDAAPRKLLKSKDAPWPVRRGGLILRFYENSLGIALVLLFIFSFGLHMIGGVKIYNQEQIEHGALPVSLMEYVTGSRFWFESFQNWQSEFLSIGILIILSVYLRQKGSPESKPVDHPHDETGKE
jgi:hypothetical protein